MLVHRFASNIVAVACQNFLNKVKFKEKFVVLSVLVVFKENSKVLILNETKLKFTGALIKRRMPITLLFYLKKIEFSSKKAKFEFLFMKKSNYSHT